MTNPHQESHKDYLQCLSEDYGVPLETVLVIEIHLAQVTR